MPSTADPRLAPDFRPGLYPSCDGDPAPRPETVDPVECGMLEFASVYYRLNCGYEDLRLARTGESDGDPASILEEIEQAVHAREALLDRLAPVGFYAEPELEGILAVNLVFSHALKTLRKPPPAEGAGTGAFSLYVPMPPPGTDKGAYLRHHVARGILDHYKKHETGAPPPPSVTQEEENKPPPSRKSRAKKRVNPALGSEIPAKPGSPPARKQEGGDKAAKSPGSLPRKK